MAGKEGGAVRLLIIAAALTSLAHLASCSYLDAPRLHFMGHFRADAATTNNRPCNFDPSLEYDPILNEDWNSIGTNEFTFPNTNVYGGVYRNGSFASGDSVIGANVVDNGMKPFAKMVIMDVDAENTSTIYGMNFGVSWGDANPMVAFKGKWMRNIISQNLWSKVKCYYGLQDTFHRGAQATTTLTDIQWADLRDSKLLSQLKQASEANGGNLQVSVSFYFYTRNFDEFVPFNFTLGYIIGAIGVAKEGEPLNFGGDRLLSPDGLMAPKLEFPTEDSCYGKEPYMYNPLMFKSHFKVYEDRRLLTVDFSNALPINMHSVLRDIGQIQVGLLWHEKGCVDLIGEVIPYLSENWLYSSGGIMDYTLNEDQLMLLQKSAALVVVRHQTQPDSETYPICSDYMLGLRDMHEVRLMLKESLYYVRPMEYYNAQLEYPNTTSISFLVTKFGKPASGVNIKVNASTYVLPEDGVVVDRNIKPTDSKGIATFSFTVTQPIPINRTYLSPPCNYTNDTVLPIDGQVYLFKYCIESECPKNLSDLLITEVAIKAFSTVHYKRPYTWDKDVERILHQYYHLFPVMNTILNLSDYYSVVRVPNIELMKLAMNRSFDNPNYMPTTRDLSPTKWKMILEWLDYPLKNLTTTSTWVIDDHSKEVVPFPICEPPKRQIEISEFGTYAVTPICSQTAIPLDPNSDFICDVRDTYFIRVSKSRVDEQKRRPLYGYSSASTSAENQRKCTLDHLKEQLQQAVDLEFATIPLYLTSLYSLVESCNPQVYELIRSVVMQEMLHLIQVANILIAIDGTPIFDSPDHAPRYPRLGLPGGTHPHLYITLEKASLQHIFDVFMAIEQPNISCVARKFPEVISNTIGQFYQEIKECITTLSNKSNIFDPERAKLQLHWPWKPSTSLGTVYIVKDLPSALDGIDEIMEQGEGASPFDPHVGVDRSQMAHYYKFQEIVCQHMLKQIDKNHYAYNGDRIPFNPNGVWQMRNNASKIGIQPGTNCYTEAKAFHLVYRALLKELQAAFGGQPHRIQQIVVLMESLLVHAKRVMRTKYNSHNPESVITCGPVWDYYWDDN